MRRLRFESFSRFYAELRRRKVVKVAAAYAIVGWLVIQIGSNTFAALHLPDWALTLVIVLTALGFPIALVIAWSVELTPVGLRAEQPAGLPNANPLQTTPALAPRGVTVSHRSNRAARPQPSVVDTEPAPPAVSASRLSASKLRHDLRTPMNGILGYCDVLIEEAAALDVERFLPDLRHLHGQANRMLERINDAVPPVTDDAGQDLAVVRARARENLFEPSRALLNEAQSIFAKAGAVEAARPDFERLVSAANKLMVLVEGLARPAGAGEESALEHSVQQALNRLRPSAAQSTGSGGTLLVVDDNAMNRDLLTRQLVRDGYNVQAVGSGREALDALRLQDFDLILLDVIMPEMDGVELLERIEQDPALSGIPVIMMSALDEIGGVARCLEKGAADYMIKPADPVLLRARVRSTLQLRHLHADLRSSEVELDEKAAAIERLTRSLAPPAFVPSMRGFEQSTTQQYPEVSAVVVRLEGIDALAARRPGETAEAIAGAFDAIERRSTAHGFDITRCGDRSFIAIAGATTWTEQHADRAADFAYDVCADFADVPNAESRPLHVRVGVHTGLLTAGLAAGEKVVFGLWGESVSTADAIAACAPLDEVQLSNATCAKLSSRFVLDAPNVIDVPGRGHLPTRRIKERR